MKDKNHEKTQNFFSSFLDEVVNREYSFTVFMIIIVVAFRNQLNGNSAHLKVDVDLFFELVLLLVPVALLVLRHKSNNEIANIFELKRTLLFFFVICVGQLVLGLFVIFATNYAFPILDAALEIFGLVLTLASILNLIIGVLILLLKIDKVHEEKRKSIR